MNAESMTYKHWAYFPTEDEARACANVLKRDLGAETVVRLAAAGSEWLLTARVDLVLDGLPESREFVRQAVSSCGGEYDGGEAGPLAGPVRTGD